MCVVKRSCATFGALVAALLLDQAGRAVAQDGGATGEIAATPTEAARVPITEEAGVPAVDGDRSTSDVAASSAHAAAESSAAADGAAPAADSATTASAEPPLRGRDDRRPVPDYDGLPDPGPTPEEVLIWFPRILLMPLYVLTEFVIRRPLGELLTVAEREGWVASLVNFFTWDGLRAGLVPVAFWDFGLLPSIGLYMFWNDAGAVGHQFRVHVAFGGIDWLRASIRDRVLLDDNVELSFRVEASRRPDRLYQGIGALSRSDDRVRFRQNELSGHAELGISFWRRSVLRLGVNVGWNDFTADGYDPGNVDPSLGAALADGSLNAAPPGFDGFVAYRQSLRLTLDTREETPAPQHGLRLDLSAEQGCDLLRATERSWVRYGGSLSGYVDAGAERVFSLHLQATFADPLGSRDVPFTELAQLGGGIITLPAFLPGALLGRSATALTLRYRWPVWVQLDASLFVGAGNVFDAHLSDFSVEALRLSWGVAIQTLGDRDHSLRIAFALGTRRLDQGGDIESVRFLLGSSLGF